MAHVVIVDAGVGGVPRAYEFAMIKVALEKYFLRKARTGSITPVYERYVLKALGIVSPKQMRS